MKTTQEVGKISYPRFIIDKPEGKDLFEGQSQNRIADTVYHKQAKGIETEKFSINFTELEEIARGGLLSLSVQLGLKALQIMLEDEAVMMLGG